MTSLLTAKMFVRYGYVCAKAINQSLSHTETSLLSPITYPAYLQSRLVNCGSKISQKTVANAECGGANSAGVSIELIVWISRSAAALLQTLMHHEMLI